MAKPRKAGYVGPHMRKTKSGKMVKVRAYTKGNGPSKHPFVGKRVFSSRTGTYAGKKISGKVLKHYQDKANNQRVLVRWRHGGKTIERVGDVTGLY